MKGSFLLPRCNLVPKIRKRTGEKINELAQFDYRQWSRTILEQVVVLEHGAVFPFFFGDGSTYRATLQVIDGLDLRGGVEYTYHDHKMYFSSNVIHFYAIHTYKKPKETR